MANCLGVTISPENRNIVMVADHLVIEMMNGGVDESKRQRLCPGQGVAEPPPAAKAVVAMKAVSWLGLDGY